MTLSFSTMSIEKSAKNWEWIQLWIFMDFLRGNRSVFRRDYLTQFVFARSSSRSMMARIFEPYQSSTAILRKQSGESLKMLQKIARSDNYEYYFRLLKIPAHSSKM